MGRVLHCFAAASRCALRHVGCEQCGNGSTLRGQRRRSFGETSMSGNLHQIDPLQPGGPGTQTRCYTELSTFSSLVDHPRSKNPIGSRACLSIAKFSEYRPQHSNATPMPISHCCIPITPGQAQTSFVYLSDVWISSICLATAKLIRGLPKLINTLHCSQNITTNSRGQVFGDPAKSVPSPPPSRTTLRFSTPSSTGGAACSARTTSKVHSWNKMKRPLTSKLEKSQKQSHYSGFRVLPFFRDWRSNVAAHYPEIVVLPATQPSTVAHTSRNQLHKHSAWKQTTYEEDVTQSYFNLAPRRYQIRPCSTPLH